MPIIRGKFLLWIICWLASIFLPRIAAEEGQGIDFGVLKLSIDTDNGFAVEKEVNIDTPLLKVHRKTKIGIGDPMVKYSEESDEDSNERRSKRDVTGYEIINPLRSEQTKQAPCYGNNPGQMPSGSGGGDGAGDGDNVDEAERRRRRRRKSSTQRKRKRQTGRRRRRREAEITDFADEAKTMSKNFSERVGEVAQKVHNFFDNVVKSTQQMVQRISYAFTDTEGKQEEPLNA